MMSSLWLIIENLEFSYIFLVRPNLSFLTAHNASQKNHKVPKTFGFLLQDLGKKQNKTKKI